tara:strand:+ start:6194 stop:6478 length:285 start_codon:yes stop_codon:yes gene_type:complete
LPQRIDEDGQALTPVLVEAIVEFIQSVEAPISPLRLGHVALNVDAFPKDNRQSHKEGVNKGDDGHLPIAASQGRGAGAWVASCALAASMPTTVS